VKAERGESLAWDRVGQFLQQSVARASEIADRNVDLWNVVSEHLKKGQYKADDMADDVARSISTAMDNMSDVWSVFTREPAQNTRAQPIPTAFLLFDWVGPYRHRLLDPVRIEAGSLLRRGDLPKRARVELNGTRAPLSDKESAAADRGERVFTSEDGVKRLSDCLVAYREEDSATYILTNVNRRLETPKPEKEGGEASGAAESDSWSFADGLVPGFYDGIVYLTDPAAALASVRILVEGAPPVEGAPSEPPIVSERAPSGSATKTV
jgi:hypothetical protein